MKLSQMSTQQLASALVALADPISNIANNDSIGKAMSDIQAKIKAAKEADKPLPVLFMVGEMIGKLIPVLLGTQAEDMFSIIVTLTGKTTGEVKAQNGLLTIKEAKESFSTELLDFFTSSAPTEEGA